MEASLLAATSAPMPPPEATSQSGQTTGETAPFNAFLSAAISDAEEPQNKAEGMSIETSASSPDQEEMALAAELAALSFQAVPVLNPQQPVSGNTIATTNSTGPIDTSAPLLLNPAELQQLQAMLATKGQTAPELTATALDQKPMQAMLAADGQPAIELAPSATSQQASPPINKNEALLTQQLQAILTGTSSQDTLSIRTSSHSQSAPTAALSTLSSPYLQSPDDTSLTATASPQVAIIEGAVAGTEAPDAAEGVRKNVEEQFLNAKLEALTNKDSAKNQHQNTSQQENSANQANQQSTNASLATSLANNEQTGLFTLTALGAQTTAATPVNASLAQPALPPGAPVPAEEIINHLVDRFSINPRLQTSKISLNLSPAELGALKIDIIVKGDSIKAHIAANSPQVQETIEKYMPKLRTILEQQGFTIEDFQVTLDSTSSDANDFFQKHYSSRQDSGPQTKFMSSNDSFDLALNSAEEILSTSPNSGINLSI
jgi:flagellar hook-length control protein FliK